MKFYWFISYSFFFFCLVQVSNSPIQLLFLILWNYQASYRGIPNTYLLLNLGFLLCYLSLLITTNYYSLYIEKTHESELQSWCIFFLVGGVFVLLNFFKLFFFPLCLYTHYFPLNAYNINEYLNVNLIRRKVFEYFNFGFSIYYKSALEILTIENFYATNSTQNPF